MSLRKATFYILKTSDTKSRNLFACRLIEKIYKNKRQIYIHTNSADDAEEINTQLWTFRDISFVPHEIYSMENASAQVLIGYENSPSKHNDILLNLAEEIPSFYQNFSRIVEIISDEPIKKKSGRHRYKIYQQNKFEIETHEQ